MVRTAHRRLTAFASAIAIAGPVLGLGIFLMVAAPANSPPATHRYTVGGLVRDGQLPAVTVSNTFAYQGGAVEVRATNASAGNVTVFGRSYTLEPAPGGGVAGFVGLAVDDPAGPTALRITVTGADGQPEALSWPLTVRLTDWTVDYITLPPGPSEILTDPAKVNAEAARLQAIYSQVTPRQWLDHWAPPVPISQADITSYFGEQRSYNGGPVEGHHGGTDIGVPAGTPVYATNTGTVVLAELLYVRGNMVIIDHGGGVFSGYAHLQQIVVTAGQHVNQGDLIGYVGSTGLATGPHLHWEMSVGGVLVDALRWLDGTQGF